MIFDVPRISNLKKDAIVPSNSSVIYNIDENRYEYFNGEEWRPLGQGDGTVISLPLTNLTLNNIVNNISTNNISGYRLNSESLSTITGFNNGSDGKILYLHNVGLFNIVIKNNSSLSDISNRIVIEDELDFILKPNSSITLQYDYVLLKWRILNSNNKNQNQNPKTLDLNNTPSIIDFSNYSTNSFRIKNPNEITLSSGIDGIWYTLAILSNGNYSFTNEVKFPLNSQPIPSSGTVDLYTFHCINTASGTSYLATFAYDYSGVIF